MNYSELIYEKGEEGLEATFSYSLKSSFAKSDHILFAYIYPYTYQDCVLSIQEVEAKCAKQAHIHFDQRVIGKSLEGRPLTQMTIASNKALEEDRPVVFFTGRVHCGESPASYMLQGVLDKLTDFENRQTAVLLDNYIFKIIPMLNPDGVARGYWRFDKIGRAHV